MGNLIVRFLYLINNYKNFDPNDTAIGFLYEFKVILTKNPNHFYFGS